MESAKGVEINRFLTCVGSFFCPGTKECVAAERRDGAGDIIRIEYW